MRIKSIRIENFRSFEDETVQLGQYSCFVGPNGAGKSNVLAALNVFFREQSGFPGDVTKMGEEDYFKKRTSNPIRITVVFDELSPRAQQELKDYFRQGELVVTAEAVFDPEAGFGTVRHYGQRLGMEEFRPYFNAEKAGAKADQLKATFRDLRAQYGELPAATTKPDMESALREYEAGHPHLCVLIRSEDNFYGVNSTGKLAGSVLWVFVPAVKDAGGESQEGKTTALGKLVARAVRTKIDFDEEIKALRTESLEKYQELLDRNQGALSELSQALQKRLMEWAHPDVKLGVEWLSDPSRAVVVQPPVAGVKTGEGEFVGSLARMGHGLQRSYLLALLQELAGSDLPDAPTLVLGCEEPELYQHPPQARHLADVLRELASGNNQVLVTTHSPLFVTGEVFDDVRLVRRIAPGGASLCRWVSLDALCARIRDASGGERSGKPIEGLVAKIHQTLQPNIAEMFFTRIPVLVEGLEDVAYIATQLHLSGRWQEFRRLGCHLVPVNGKDKLDKPLAIALELGLPVFVVFDADGDAKNESARAKHEKDNRSILSLLGAQSAPFPTADLWGDNFVVWKRNLTQVVQDELGPGYSAVAEQVRLAYAQEENLGKNVLFIADVLAGAKANGCDSPSLGRLCEAILDFAAKEHAP
ncbi:MAG: ATP-dependent endonuclease [Thermoanaerobaculaceae bacterium]